MRGNGKTMDDWLTQALKEARDPVRHNTGSWAEVEPETLRDFIAAITTVGGACLMGTTSDGGAMSVLIMHNDAKHRLYEADADVMTQMLQQWTFAAGKGQNGKN